MLYDLAFVHVEKVGAMVGGGTARTDAIHVGADGRVQVSTEETNGVLHRLREGRVDVRPFFRERAGAEPLPPSPPQDPGMATELYPPTRVVAESIPTRGYASRSWPEGRVPDRARALIADVEALAASTLLSEAEPGLYVRAYRMESPETAAVTPEVVVDAERARTDAALMRVVESEMSLARMAGAEDTARFAAFDLLPERPMHVRIGDRVFVMFAYRYVPR